MRYVETDRYVIAVERTSIRTTTNDLTDAKQIAEGFATWREHRGRRVTVLDRDAAPRATASIFGGTRTVTTPAVVWSVTAVAA